jgi:WD40 repeat protein
LNNTQSFLYTKKFMAGFVILCVGILAIVIMNLSKPHGLLLKKDASYVFSVSWSPDGSKLASAKDSREIDIWDTTSWNLLETLVGHNYYVHSVTWNANGTKLASVSGDNTARIWDVKSKQILSTFDIDDYAAANVRWSRNGDRLITSSFFGPGITQIWSPYTSSLLSTFPNHMDKIDLNPDATKLALVNDDGTLDIRDINKPGQIDTFSSSLNKKWFWTAWSPDGSKVASEDSNHNVRIWNAITGQLIGSLSVHTNFINGLAWSADGKKLASSSDDNTVRLWNVDNLTLINQMDISKDQYILGSKSGPDGLLWDHLGDKLAVEGGNMEDQKNHIPGQPNIVFVWNVVTGELITILDHDRSVSSMAWSPDDSKLATSGGYGIMIWPIPDNSHSK